jgi:hypothetical protein
MKRAPDLVRDHHALRVTILLIVAILVVLAAACRHGTDTYQLTISSASGGNVIIPGEGTFAYDTGTVVPLVAVPDDGYHFVSWTGDIASIADPNAASTTIAVNGNYGIVANLETEGGGGSDGNGGHTQP